MTYRSGMKYRGWTITHNPLAPVTGRWRAERFGVGMCHPTKDGIHRMVDAKVNEQQAERKS